MSRMKLTFLFAALFTALVSAGVAYAVIGPSSADISSQDTVPNLVSPYTSTVPYPYEQPTRDFVIGLKGSGGYCNMLKVSAPTEMEALLYARDYCPTCNLQNLTGQHVQGDAPWENLTPLSQVFCTAK